MPGKNQAEQQEAETTIEFRQSRQHHPGVESAIGALQSGNGLVRGRDRTEVGFERYVACSAEPDPCVMRVQGPLEGEGGFSMSRRRRRHTPEQIISKLCHDDAMLAAEDRFDTDLSAPFLGRRYSLTIFHDGNPPSSAAVCARETTTKTVLSPLRGRT